MEIVNFTDILMLSFNAFSDKDISRQFVIDIYYLRISFSLFYTAYSSKNLHYVYYFMK